MKVLITGGGGFIGSHIAEACVAAGYAVVVVDDLSSGKRHQVPAEASFHQVDICGTEIADIMAEERPEVLIHHAAQMDVRRSVSDPRFDAQVNIDGLLNLLEAGRQNGLRRVLFASSGGAGYGEQEEFPATEEHPLAPMSPYGVAKIASELYLGCYQAIYGLEWVALRYANVYGPRQDPHGEAGVVAIFARKILAGETPTINGDGGQTRDYVFVADLVRANLALISSTYCGPLNFGTGIETDVNRLHQLIAKACGQGDAAANRGPAKAGEQRRSVISPSKAGEVLGWRPEVTLESGIPQTVDFFRS
jgi:UDP-glucose 4-epimerase